MAEDNQDIIKQAINEPLKASDGSGSVEKQSLRDMIEAEKFLEQRRGGKVRAIGVVRVKRRGMS